MGFWDGVKGWFGDPESARRARAELERDDRAEAEKNERIERLRGEREAEARREMAEHGGQKYADLTPEEHYEKYGISFEQRASNKRALEEVREAKREEKLRDLRSRDFNNLTEDLVRVRDNEEDPDRMRDIPAYMMEDGEPRPEFRESVELRREWAARRPEAEKELDALSKEAAEGRELTVDEKKKIRALDDLRAAERAYRERGDREGPDDGPNREPPGGPKSPVPGGPERDGGPTAGEPEREAEAGEERRQGWEYRRKSREERGGPDEDPGQDLAAEAAAREAEALEEEAREQRRRRIEADREREERERRERERDDLGPEL